MRAIITGASKGIGNAIARAFARKGFDLAITARNDKDLQKFRNDLGQAFPGISILARRADCSDKDSLKTFTEYVLSQWEEPVNVLVHNAGLYLEGEMMEEPEENLRKMIDTNLYAVYDLSRAFVPGMKRNKRGHIFTICSSASLAPAAGIGSYSASKYALYGFTKNLREELKEHNIKVTAILPGSTLTHSWAGTTVAPEKFIQPEDIASAVMTAYNMSGGAAAEEIIINTTNKI